LTARYLPESKEPGKKLPDKKIRFFPLAEQKTEDRKNGIVLKRVVIRPATS
jgi:hypothetical protein